MNYDFKDLAVDSDQDLLFENGDLVVASDHVAIAEAIAFRMMTAPSEWRTDASSVFGVKRFMGLTLNNELISRLKREIMATVARGLQLSPTELIIDISRSQANPSELSLTIEIIKMNFVDKSGLVDINQPGVQKNNMSIKSFYNLDMLTGKLTYIDDLL